MNLNVILIFFIVNIVVVVHLLVFMCPQKRDVSSEDKEKFPYDIVKMALPPEAQLAADAEV